MFSTDIFIQLVNLSFLRYIKINSLLILKICIAMTEKVIVSKVEISSKIKSIIVAKLGIDENEVKPESKFTDDLGADSLDLVEVATEVEKEFSIRLDANNEDKNELYEVHDVEGLENLTFKVANR